MEPIAKDAAPVEPAEPTVAKTSDGQLTEDRLDSVSGGANATTTLTNLSNMQHEMKKAIAQNLRG